jgi:hypothetical protein
MKVRCERLLPGQVVPARMAKAPSLLSRSEERDVLELDAGAPVQLDPPTALGTVVVEATPQEWAALRAAGYDLPQA